MCPIALHGPAYLVFTTLVIAGGQIFRDIRGRKIWLLVTSYLFIAMLDLRSALILLVMTGINLYFSNILVSSKSSRAWLYLSIGINLTVLIFFKHAGIFTSIASPALRIFLPVGISYYLFQAIGYLVGLTKDRSRLPFGPLDLALYLNFFPKFVAGPLARPVDFLDQINQPYTGLDRGSLKLSVRLLLLGYFKKVIIADGLAVLGLTAFHAAGQPGGESFPMGLYWQGFYLYAVQIFADFSGYTDLARGSALLFGIRLPENFDRPYFAGSLTEFWNRWHMSLTQWFREYFFFPLSRTLLRYGERTRAELVQTGVTLITMLLIGWWHGAQLTFLAWGAYHGVLLTFEQRLGINRMKRTGSGWLALGSKILTFHLVVLGWVLFQAPTFAAAGRFFYGMVAGAPGWWQVYLPPVVLSIVLLILLEVLSHPDKIQLPHWMMKLQPVWVVAVLVLVGCMWLLQASQESASRPFIYGQF